MPEIVHHLAEDGQGVTVVMSICCHGAKMEKKEQEARCLQEILQNKCSALKLWALRVPACQPCDSRANVLRGNVPAKVGELRGEALAWNLLGVSVTC